MPNDGNKIYSQTQNGKRYGVSLDQDVCVVLGLPQTTDLWTAATSSRVNPDSLIKPVPVSTPPNLTTAGKTDAVVKSELLQHLGTLNYGYTIPKISVKSTLTEEDMTANKNAIWSRRGFGYNDFAVLDHFDGYNHSVKYTGQWGPTSVSAVPGTVGFDVQLAHGGASMDMVAPVNMVNSDVGPNSYYGVAVYWKYATQGTFAYRCVAILAANDAVSGSVASSVRLSGNPLKQGETYVFVPFYSTTAITQTINTSVQNGGIVWANCGLNDANNNVYCATYKSGYPSIVEAVAVNTVPTYGLTISQSGLDVTGIVTLNGTAYNGYWYISFRVYRVRTNSTSDQPTIQGQPPSGEQWTELWNGYVSDEYNPAHAADFVERPMPLPPVSSTETRGDYIVIRANATAPSAKTWSEIISRGQASMPDPGWGT